MAISEVQKIKNEIARIRNGGVEQAPTMTVDTDLQAKSAKKNGGLLGGAGYLLEQVGLGAVRSVEGITDYVVGGVADLLGGDEFAENLMKNDWLNYEHANEWYDPGKVMSFVGDVAQGVGGMLPSLAITWATAGAAAPVALAGQVGSTAAFTLGAAGQSTSEAVKKTGDLSGKEWLYGTASGALEAGIEAATGGIGGTKAGKVFGKQLGKTALGKAAISFAGEGVEEAVSDIANPLLKRATGVDKTAKMPTVQELGRTFAVGGATGAVMGALNTGISSLKAGGYNNYKVSETLQELTERNAESNQAQAEGEKGVYTQEDRGQTADNLSKRLQKMSESSRKEFLSKNSNIAFMFNEDGTVANTTNESTAGTETSKQGYNADSYSESLKGYEGKLAYKPLSMGSGLVTTAKNVMNTLTKLTQGKANIVLTEEKLSANDGQSANGLYKDGIIYLNAKATDGEKALAVGVHEVIHGLEGTKEYEALAKHVAEMINADPELKEQYSVGKYRNAYDKLLEGEWTEGTKDYQAVTEIFADFLGNAVAKSKTLLNNLASRDKNVIQRLVEWVRNGISSLGETEEERKTRKELKKLEGLLVNALEAGTGGISLEEVEKNIKRGEELRKNGNVQSVKFGETVDNKSAVGYNKAQARASLSISDTMYRLPKKDTVGRASIDVDADLADFPSIDKWFDALTAEELRELIDNDYSVEDISEELNVAPQKMRYLIRREGLGDSYVEDSKKAVMKQARIDEAIDDSGASNPTYARDYITAISPKDFIDLTVRTDHVDRESFDREVIGDHGGVMGEWDYEKALQTSRSPYLQIDKATGRVIGHNGRHRIRALEKAGIQSVEIQVEFFDEDGRLIKYDSETIPKMAISSQFDTDIETTISKIIPLNESHRTEIEATYGEKATPKAGVRYALDAELDKKTTERVQTVVSDEKLTLKERWENTVEKLKEGKADQWIKAQIAWTDEQAGIIAAGRNLGIVVHGEVQRARTAKASAINMLNNEQRDYSGKKRVGDSLKDIFKPIQSRGKKVAQDFNLYLLHQLNVDRMSAEERGLGENKPVFEEKVDKAFSLEKIKELEKQYPEFKEYAEKVWKYSQNLLQYRVDAGLITQEQADKMMEMYPHYVPAFYEKNGGGTSGAFVGQKGIAVKTGIKSAKGSTGVSDIKDVQASIAKQTVAVIRAASINKVVEKLYDGAVAKGDFTDIEEVGREKMTDPDVDYDKEIPKEDNVYFYKDGERITLAVTQYVDAGFRGLTAGAQIDDPLTKVSEKAIDLFKKSVTAWNPLFAITNAVRDAQEALFYTKYGKRFFANYGKALVTRKSDPRLKELWEQYKAMGGTGSGYFSRETGVYDNRSKLKKGREWLGEKMQVVNEWVEQAPRFAEFVASVEAGNSLEQALYDSAEVTTNFSRGGNVTKKLNRCLIPFLNPSVQGWSKLWRSWVAPMDGKSAAEIAKLSQQSNGRRFLSNYGALMFKAILCGVSVGLFNDMLYRWIDDDEDYENLPLNIKENYYLIKVGKKFIKIPKGRVVALYGSVATRIVEAANGNEDALDAWNWAKSASEMVSPLENASRTILAPIFDAKTNTTWYGGEIENASMENLAPSERYDEGTSSIAIAIGKVLNKSPKKIHYILDQYSGVVGDFILPKTTNKAEKNMFSSRFVVDPVYNNDISTKYYDYKEELTYAKNSGDANAKLMLKYINEVQDDLSKMYQQKRDIANDKSLSRKEKSEQTEIIQGLINATLSSSVDMADNFEQLLINSGFEQAVGILGNNATYKKMDEKAQNSAYNKLTEYYYEACLARLNGAKLGTKYTLYGAINATDIVVYLTDIGNIESDTDKKGNVIQGSRKEKVQKYIQGLKLTAQQKYILSYLEGYAPTDNGKSAISKYLKNNGYTQKEVNNLWKD